MTKILVDGAVWSRWWCNSLRNNGCQSLITSLFKEHFYGVRRKITESWTHADHCKELCPSLPKHKGKWIQQASQRNREELKRKMEMNEGKFLFFRRISQSQRFWEKLLWKFIKPSFVGGKFDNYCFVLFYFCDLRVLALLGITNCSVSNMLTGGHDK